jgi:translation elongation factor EF-G
VLVADMIEGSGMWMLEAVIPVIESFDLDKELRVKHRNVTNKINKHD